MHKPPNSNAWLTTTIEQGLAYLLLANLPYSPTVDTVRGVAMVWIDAAQRFGLLEADRDKPRIEEAFRSMAASCRQWPAPSELRDYLPELARPYFHKLPAPELTDEEEQADRARRADIVQRETDRLRRLMRGEQA